MTTENWIDLPTLQDLAKAQADGWEIEFKTIYEGWAVWEQATWNGGIPYRGRPRQPKMKEVKMECWLIDGRLDWRDWNEPTQGSRWIRQPHLDLIAKEQK